MPSLEVSNGNSKIGNDTLILNICSATDCPSKKLGMCHVGDKCYAMKAERQYPAVLPYRRRQEAYWDSMDGLQIAWDLDETIKKHKSKIKFLRFSESGDFRHQGDVYKMNLIAVCLYDIVQVYGYTARRDLDFSDVPNNMVVNGSGFMVHNSFTAVEKVSKKDLVCPGDCRTCNLCKSAGGRNIKVLYH